MKLEIWNKIFLVGGVVVLVSLIVNIIHTINFNKTTLTSMPLSTVILFTIVKYLVVNIILLVVYLIIRKGFIK